MAFSADNRASDALRRLLEVVPRGLRRLWDGAPAPITLAQFPARHHLAGKIRFPHPALYYNYPLFTGAMHLLGARLINKTRKPPIQHTRDPNGPDYRTEARSINGRFGRKMGAGSGAETSRPRTGAARLKRDRAASSWWDQGMEGSHPHGCIGTGRRTAAARARSLARRHWQWRRAWRPPRSPRARGGHSAQ